MAKPKLPAAHLWREREISDWNTKTFSAYLCEKHEEIYGIKYTPSRGGWKQELGMIKQFMDKQGKETTKAFIDICFKEHKNNPQYPGLNFWFMKTYLESQKLPRVLQSKKNEVVRKEREEKQKMSVDEMLDLL